MSCYFCDKPAISYKGLDDEYLCEECARREIMGLLNDLDIEGFGKLHKEVKEHINKSTANLMDIATLLIIKGTIKLST